LPKKLCAVYVFSSELKQEEQLRHPADPLELLLKSFETGRGENAF
jgi:hypothetical protein